MANKPIDSSFLKAEVLRFKSQVIDPLLNAKQPTLSWDSKPTASSTNPVTSGGVYSAVDEVKNAIAVMDATSINLPTGTDLNNVFYSGYTPSTAVCQSMLHVPNGWKMASIGEMNIRFIPESAKNADGSYSYGTQILYGETTSGVVGEWRRVWSGVWSAWTTIVDPLDTNGWVDISSVVTRNNLISDTSFHFYVCRKNGLMMYDVVFKYTGNKTTSTQNNAVTNIPERYRPSKSITLYCSGYYSGGVAGANLSFDTNGVMAIQEIGIDSSGLLKDVLCFPVNQS